MRSCKQLLLFWAMALVLAGQSTAAEDLSRKNYDHMVVDVSTGTDTSETAREKIESEIDKHDAFSGWRLIAVVQGTTAGGASNGDWRLFFERER